MYGHTLVLIIGEAKRRRNLDIPPREKMKTQSCHSDPNQRVYFMFSNPLRLLNYKDCEF